MASDGSPRRPRESRAADPAEPSDPGLRECMLVKLHELISDTRATGVTNET